MKWIVAKVLDKKQSCFISDCENVADQQIGICFSCSKTECIAQAVELMEAWNQSDIEGQLSEALAPVIAKDIKRRREAS